MDKQTVKHWLLSGIGALLRGVTVWLTAALTARVTLWLLAKLFTLPERDPPWLWAALLWGTMAGFVLILSRGDARERYDYLCRAGEEEKIADSFRRLIAYPFFWLEAAAYLFCLFYWPEFTRPGVALLTAAGPGTGGFILAQFLMLGLPWLLLRLAAGTGVRRGWYRERAGFDPAALPRGFGLWRGLREVALWGADIILAVMAAALLRSVWQGLFGIASSLGAAIALPVASVIALIALSLWLRGAIKRRRMRRRLERICRERGYTLTVRRGYYLSLLFPRREEDLILTGPKPVPVKLIACRNPLVRLRLQEGTYTFYHKVGFGKMFFYVPVRHRFRFTQEGRRMLVLCPSTPNTAFGDMKTAAPADNGDRLGDAMLFTSTAFCNYLERSL